MDTKVSKNKLIGKVENSYKSGMPIRKIVKEVGISRNTVRKYIAMEILDYTYSSNCVKEHNIYHNVKLGKAYAQISNRLREKGINYFYSLVAKYCNKLKKSNNLNRVYHVKN